MNLRIFGRAGRMAAIGAILLGSASCVDIDETLGENFIPTDHIWDVYTPEAVPFENIMLHMADSLSGYSNTRFTFGAINDGVLGTTIKSASFTLVPIAKSLDFGTDTKVRQFHFTAVRDTLSMMDDNQLKMLQNVYVSELKKDLDTNVIYAGSFSQYTAEGLKNRETYLDLGNRITDGIPVYNGGDSLSFDFSKEFTERFIAKLQEVKLDSMSSYVKALPGILITTDSPAGVGGRINMFDLPIATDSYGYISGNYAELKFTAKYDYSEEPVDTSFVFYFGPAEFLTDDHTSYPTQFAFNMSDHETIKAYQEGVKATDKIYVEGGSGIKPVVKAAEIKTILEDAISKEGKDPKDVVINKATVIFPYNVEGDYERLEKYPMILSPTVRLRSTSGTQVSYAGLTDSSIESENQGDINRSLSMYSPDISHHVQEILKLDKSAEDYEKKLENYDIWFLIMHEEITTTSNNSSYNDYYNYYMMAAYASAASSTSTSSSTELDKDRFYSAVLCGPEYGTEIRQKPRFKFTFSAPKSDK